MESFTLKSQLAQRTSEVPTSVTLSRQPGPVDSKLISELAAARDLAETRLNELNAVRSDAAMAKTVQAIEAKAEIDRMAQHLSKVQRDLEDSKALHRAQVCSCCSL